MSLLQPGSQLHCNVDLILKLELTEIHAQTFVCNVTFLKLPDGVKHVQQHMTLMGALQIDIAFHMDPMVIFLQ